VRKRDLKRPEYKLVPGLGDRVKSSYLIVTKSLQYVPSMTKNHRRFRYRRKGKSVE
jgi:hypothetical protein